MASSSLLMNPEASGLADFLSVIYLLTLVLKHATNHTQDTLATMLTRPE